MAQGYIIWHSQYFIITISGIGEGNGTPLQYSCLENPMDGGAWKAAVHGVPESRTRLSDFTFTSHFHALEKEMATHSSVLAWSIPGMGEPVGLPSMRSHRVGHDWSDFTYKWNNICKKFETLCCTTETSIIDQQYFKKRKITQGYIAIKW